ncbi:MAG TPA: rRNA maturation RNase YbeY [Stellaceae bacterium]|nr:rRNA maturation RNase YbeY [Stellaceae bacterium]
MLSVEIGVECEEWRRACPEAAVLARAAAEAAFKASDEKAKLPPSQRIVIGVTLADDTEQRRLNRIWRGKDASTNVLAFPVAGSEAPPSGAPLLLGDVVLALETIAAEAAAQNKPLADHLRHLVVHGVLHLLGHDHQEPTEADAMERHETAILVELGVPDPYRDII